MTKNALIFTILVECGWLTNSFFLFGSSRGQISIQSDNSIEIYRLRRHRTDRQTLSYKPFFLTQGVSKPNDSMKIPKVIFQTKPIPFHLMRM